jgi:hypothetical protein
VTSFCGSAILSRLSTRCAQHSSACARDGSPTIRGATRSSAHFDSAVTELNELAKSDDAGTQYIAIALSLNRMLTENLTNRRLRSMLQALTLLAIALCLAAPAAIRELRRAALPDDA